jgi:hypothetical protein
MSSTLRTQRRAQLGKYAKVLKSKYNGAFKHQRRSERKVEENK